MIRDSHARVNLFDGFDRFLFFDREIGIAVTATTCGSQGKPTGAPTADRVLGFVDELADIRRKPAILDAELSLPGAGGRPRLSGFSSGKTLR